MRKWLLYPKLKGYCLLPSATQFWGFHQPRLLHGSPCGQGPMWDPDIQHFVHTIKIRPCRSCTSTMNLTKDVRKEENLQNRNLGQRADKNQSPTTTRTSLTLFSQRHHYKKSAWRSSASEVHHLIGGLNLKASQAVLGSVSICFY